VTIQGGYLNLKPSEKVTPRIAEVVAANKAAILAEVVAEEQRRNEQIELGNREVALDRSEDSRIPDAPGNASRVHELVTEAEGSQESFHEAHAEGAHRCEGGEGVDVIEGTGVCRTCHSVDLYRYYPGFPWLCYHCYPDGADGILEWRKDPPTDFVNAQAERQAAAVAASAVQDPERNY